MGTQFCLNTSANTPRIQHEVFGSRRCFCCQLCPGSCNPPQRCCCACCHPGGSSRQSCSPRSCSLPICPWSLSIWRQGCLCCCRRCCPPSRCCWIPICLCRACCSPQRCCCPFEPADVVQARADHLAAHSA